MDNKIVITIKGEEVEISKTLIEHVIGIDPINKLNDPNLSEEELYKILLRIDMAIGASATDIIYPKNLKDKGIAEDEVSKARFYISKGDYAMANRCLLKAIKSYESIIKEALLEEPEKESTANHGV